MKDEKNKLFIYGRKKGQKMSDEFIERANIMKKGSVKFFTPDGEAKYYSDFERGRAAGQNDMVKEQQRIFKYKNPNYKRKTKK